jgi:quinol monooxygenase YgiN
MIYVLYEFQCRPSNSEAFVRLWTDATELIRSSYGSLGSRLHRTNDGIFIGYAAWPDVETFERSNNLHNAQVDTALARMRAVLIESKRLHIMSAEADLLRV